LNVGVLAPNSWQAAHCVVPVNEECALESGPGEICAVARTGKIKKRRTNSASTAHRCGSTAARRIVLKPSERSNTLASVRFLQTAKTHTNCLLPDGTGRASCRDIRLVLRCESCTVVQFRLGTNEWHEVGYAWKHSVSDHLARVSRSNLRIRATGGGALAPTLDCPENRGFSPRGIDLNLPQTN